MTAEGVFMIARVLFHLMLLSHRYLLLFPNLC
jgi:hypothetical protein